MAWQQRVGQAQEQVHLVLLQTKLLYDRLGVQGWRNADHSFKGIDMLGIMPLQHFAELMSMSNWAYHQTTQYAS